RVDHFLEQDVRTNYYVSLQLLVQNSMLSTLFIRDQLSDPAWWAANLGLDDQREVLPQIREWGIDIVFRAVYGAAAVTEEALRAIVRAAPTGTFPAEARPSRDFGALAPIVMRTLNLEELAP